MWYLAIVVITVSGVPCFSCNLFLWWCPCRGDDERKQRMDELCSVPYHIHLRIPDRSREPRKHAKAKAGPSTEQPVRSSKDRGVPQVVCVRVRS